MAELRRGAQERLILHCDCNNFFASCECIDHPELKNVPMAVAGDPATRTGIVVAKNELAKKAGVRTTDTVWQAKRKCPGLVLMPPRHRLYSDVSRRVNQIYLSYTDRVEPASIDESYLDLSGTLSYYGMTARQLADDIRRRVREEIGVTISVGVSYNKVFAKMGSDYRKPDATTLVTPENFRDLLWPLPIREMLFVGRASARVLTAKGIYTIGALARMDERALRQWLGKGGETLWRNANGLDDEPVRLYGDVPLAKSVSRGLTFPRDLTGEAEIYAGLALLVDEVAACLRREGLKGTIVQLTIKSPELTTICRQATLPRPTFLYHEVLDAAMRLARENWPIDRGAPIRALTVGVSRLVPSDEATEQLSLFEMPGGEEMAYEKRRRQEKLESAIDGLRARFGRDAVSFSWPIEHPAGARGCEKASPFGEAPQEKEPPPYGAN